MKKGKEEVDASSDLETEEDKKIEEEDAEDAELERIEEELAAEKEREQALKQRQESEARAAKEEKEMAELAQKAEEVSRTWTSQAPLSDISTAHVYITDLHTTQYHISWQRGNRLTCPDSDKLSCTMHIVPGEFPISGCTAFRPLDTDLLGLIFFLLGTIVCSW